MRAASKEGGVRGGGEGGEYEERLELACVADALTKTSVQMV